MTGSQVLGMSGSGYAGQTVKIPMYHTLAVMLFRQQNNNNNNNNKKRKVKEAEKPSCCVMWKRFGKSFDVHPACEGQCER